MHYNVLQPSNGETGEGGFVVVDFAICCRVNIFERFTPYSGEAKEQSH